MKIVLEIDATERCCVHFDVNHYLCCSYFRNKAIWEGYCSLFEKYLSFGKEGKYNRCRKCIDATVKTLPKSGWSTGKGKDETSRKGR